MLLCRLRSSSRVAALLFLLAGLGGAALRGQPAYLVRDINATPGGNAFVEHSFSYGRAEPPWVEHEGILLCAAYDGISGAELWRSDGTAEGTLLVRGLTPGAASSYVSGLTPLDGSFVFSSRTQLWKTDGTLEGTGIVDPSLVDPTGLTLFNGVVYFNAWTPETSTELWKSDGTEAGKAGPMRKEICVDT